jgi:protein-disulfide isomerase
MARENKLGDFHLNGKMRITLLSLACCLPASAASDQKYMERINTALAKASVEATIDKVSGLDAAFGMSNVDLSKLVPLYDKYGTSVAPVLFVNGELALYGGVPTVEKLTEVIEKAKGGSKKG